jgi:hypothetical protein
MFCNSDSCEFAIAGLSERPSGLSIMEAFYFLQGLSLYSPECVEGEFCELRFIGILRSR